MMTYLPLLATVEATSIVVSTVGVVDNVVKAICVIIFELTTTTFDTTIIPGRITASCSVPRHVTRIWMMCRRRRCQKSVVTTLAGRMFDAAVKTEDLIFFMSTNVTIRIKFRIGKNYHRRNPLQHSIGLGRQQSEDLVVKYPVGKISRKAHH